jgi:hypothetical protein
VIVGTALALAPMAERRLNLWVDKWVFQQLDFSAAVPLVWRELSELESQNAIFSAAEQVLTKSTASSCGADSSL